MNQFREEWLRQQEEEDLALFEKIKGDPHPDIADLWAISERRFIEWRKLHNFPRLLSHFDHTLNLFDQWKKENQLTNEMMIESGSITPFLERKRFAKKDKSLYLTKQSWDKGESKVVLHKKLEGEINRLGTKINCELLLKFTSYLDWLHAKGLSQEILNINFRSAPRTPAEQVYIHADVYAIPRELELLKMGGGLIPVNGMGLLEKGKYLEFVNLCGLGFTGDIAFGGLGNLECSYCVCDNWYGEEFNMPMLQMSHCTVFNFNVRDSKLQQWYFYDCGVSGDFVNTKLQGVQIVGGSFDPNMQDCNLIQVDIGADDVVGDFNINGYKKLKKIYSDQGDESMAKEYFIKENEWVRRRLKGWNRFTKSISYYYWEYGRKPHRIIYYSLGIILSFSLIYWMGSDSIALNSPKITHFSIGDSIYFSTITFTTVGYGDLSPLGWLGILSSIEAFGGVLNMGFLIAGYANNKY